MLWWDHLIIWAKSSFITIWGPCTPSPLKPAAPTEWVLWGALLLALSAPPPEAPQRETWGKGSVVQARKL